MSWVKEGGMVELSRKHLKAVLQGTAPDDIIYSIMPLDGKPEHGNTSLAINMLITCKQNDIDKYMHKHMRMHLDANS